MTNICYQKHKERHQNISEEEKSRRLKRSKKDIRILLKKEKEKEKKRYNKNLSEEQKPNLVEYRRNYYLTRNK